MRSKRIKCPYCMMEFAVDQLCFRAITAFPETKEETEKEEISNVGETPELNQKLAMIGRYTKCKPDETFGSFWNEFSMKKKEKDSDHPVICSDNLDDMQARVISSKRKRLPYMIDYFGEKSDIRLCPKCHCNLPFDYGKDPTIFVSLLGSSNELMESFRTAIQHELAKMKEVACKLLDDGQGYVEHNDKGRKFCPPVIYSLRKRERDWTLVLRSFLIGDCKTLGEDWFFRKCMANTDRTIILWGSETVGRLLNGDGEAFQEMGTVVDSLTRIYTTYIETEKKRKKEYAIALAIVRNGNEKWEWISEEGQLERDKVPDGYLDVMLRKIEKYFGVYRFFVCNDKAGGSNSADYDSIWQWVLEGKGKFGIRNIWRL